jgi:hypothetical protein
MRQRLVLSFLLIPCYGECISVSLNSCTIHNGAPLQVLASDNVVALGCSLPTLSAFQLQGLLQASSGAGDLYATNARKFGGLPQQATTNERSANGIENLQQ